MAGMGRIDFRELQQLQAELEKMQQNADVFLGSCAKELASRLLRKVVKRTPVGKRGSRSGTLKRGWTGGQKADARAFAESLPVRCFGGNYVVEVTNPTDYASYVEYGHRTANHKGWVTGRFMMTISERELQGIAPKVLEKKIQEFMERCFR